MRQLVLLLIALYRRFISPHKGFPCANRVHRGGLSCSAFGAQVVQRHGVPAGLLILRRRLRACGRVHDGMMVEKRRTWTLRGHAHAEHGNCDVPIDDYACLSLFDCSCSGCDWPTEKKKKSKKPVVPSYRQTAEEKIMGQY